MASDTPPPYVQEAHPTRSSPRSSVRHDETNMLIEGLFQMTMERDAARRLAVRMWQWMPEAERKTFVETHGSLPELDEWKDGP